MNSVENRRLAMRVSVVSIVVNLLLSAFKLVAGVVAHSSAMVSDAVHSASDVMSTFVVIAGVRISGKQPDREHRYGHDRLESVAAIGLAVLLLGTGLGIGASGVQKIFGHHAPLQTPGMLALAAAVTSIAIKEWMYWYTRAAAIKTGSDALRADAWHHRSDALSSVGSLIGILGARMGFPLCDPLASLVICVLIVKAAYQIAREAVEKLVDSSCDVETLHILEELALEQEGVRRVDDLRTRKFGSSFYVDIEIACDGEQTLWQTHRIAQTVHDKIEGRFPLAKHCMVHVNPFEELEERQ